MRGVSTPAANSRMLGAVRAATTQNTTLITTTSPIRTFWMVLYVPDSSRPAAVAPISTTPMLAWNPVRRLKPSEAPSRLPAWNAALPSRMPAPTRNVSVRRSTGDAMLARIDSPNPRRPARPTRAAMSWRTMVAATANTIVQSRAAP